MKRLQQWGNHAHVCRQHILHHVRARTAAGIARTSTPPPHAGKPASKGKPSALLSKLGAKGGAAAAGGPGGRGKSATPPLRGATGRERPPPAALEGARQKSVALCLLGLLAERTYKRQVRCAAALGVLGCSVAAAQHVQASRDTVIEPSQ